MKRCVLLLAALALAISPAAALAKKKHKKPTKLGPGTTVLATGPVVNGSGTVTTAVASCPAGLAATGGGFSLSQDTNPQTTGVFESYRSAPGSWTASAITTGLENGQVNAFAYCRHTTRAISDVAATGSLPGGSLQTGKASATCPTGTQAIGGGFQVSRTEGTRFLGLPQSSMSVSGSTWSVLAINNGSAPQTITAHADCLAGIRAPTVVSSATTATLNQDQTVTSTSPSCPVVKKSKKKKGKKKKRPQQLLSAGGFSMPPPSGEPIALLTATQAGPTGWVSTAANVTNTTGPLTITSQGICVG